MMIAAGRCALRVAARQTTLAARSVHTTTYMRADGGRRYTEQHEWVSVSGGEATVGISKHAADLLGEVVFVDLPDVGRDIVKGEETGTVESVKAASDVYAPVGGNVTAINEALADTPKLLNDSPYVEGWMYKLKLSEPLEVDALMDEQTYEKFAVEQE